jgi:hypothetical protein
MALQNLSHQIVKQTDKNIIDAIVKSASEASFSITRINISPSVGGNALNLQLNDLKNNSELNELISLGSELITNFVFNFQPNSKITINRDPTKPYDKISFEFVGLEENQRTQTNKFYWLVRDHIKVTDSSKVIKTELNEQLNRHYEIRESELSKLESVTESMIGRNEQFLKQKSEEFLNDKKALVEEFEAKIEKIKSDYSAKEQALGTEREKLNAKLKEIDDREAKHVRRKIREDLREEFKRRSQKFGLTEGTIKLRRPINIFTVILLVLFGIGFGIYSYLSTRQLLSPDTNSSVLIALAIKQILMGLAFASTAVFFIRWNNKWFDKHSTEEFRLKRHEIDIDRASWLVEMAFEWQTEKDTDIPIELIDKLGENLFKEDKVEEAPLHPSDQLASAILGAASGVSVKVPGGTEVTLDRKGLNRLR